MKGFHWLAKILVLFPLLALAACGSGDGPSIPSTPEPIATPGIVPLSAIQPIFNSNCLTACHQPSGIGFATTGLDLTAGVNYSLLFNQPSVAQPGLAAGVRVLPRDANNSVLYQRISGIVTPQMPLDAAPLSTADQALIKRWIDDGASTAGQLNAVLSGSQISAASGGPVATAAGGSGTLTLNSDRSAINYTLDLGAVADFTSPITAAHIHARNPGSLDGPVIFPFTVPSPLPATLVLSGTLTAADFQAGTSAASFADAVAALLDGSCYFQVHTVNHGPGEIRGQIGLKTFPAAVLDGAQVVPTAVTTNAAGTGTLTINPDQDAVSVALDLGQFTSFSGIPSAVHINLAAAGANGPVLFDLPLDLQSSRVRIATLLTAADLDPGAGVTFAGAVDALLSGNAYVQVDTLTNPGGEIRGQILP